MRNIETVFGQVPNTKETEWGLVEEYFSPLEPFYTDPTITEIMVNRFDDISVERSGKLEHTDARFDSEQALQTLIEQVGKCLEQHVGDDQPILDARLPDCSRLCCTLPAVSPQGATLTLRVAPRSLLDAEQLVGFGALTQEMLDFLIEHVKQGSNLLISGNTGSGKTSLLRALAKYIPQQERVVTCEDTQELFLDWLQHKVFLESPKRKHGKLEMKNLIETALRMRPDRIWVGEIRNALAADAFLQAINTGHTGCVTTIHANSCEDAVKRLQYLIASAGLIDYDLAGKQITGAVNVLIQTKRDPNFGRKISEISMIENDVITPQFIFDKTKLQHQKRELC